MVISKKQTNKQTECYEVEAGAKLFLAQTVDSHNQYCPIKVQITQSDWENRTFVWFEQKSWLVASTVYCDCNLEETQHDY